MQKARLINMENQVQLAHVLEASIERFHQNLDQVQDAQLGFRRIDTKHKVERCIVPVDQLVICTTDQTKNIDRIMNEKLDKSDKI